MDGFTVIGLASITILTVHHDGVLFDFAKNDFCEFNVYAWLDMSIIVSQSEPPENLYYFCKPVLQVMDYSLAKSFVTSKNLYQMHSLPFRHVHGYPIFLTRDLKLFEIILPHTSNKQFFSKLRHVKKLN